MEHEVAVASLTGGMAPTPAPFVGSDRLHPDGRPKGAFRDSLRTVPDARNALAASGAVAFPLAVVAAAVIVACVLLARHGAAQGTDVADVAEAEHTSTA